MNTRHIRIAGILFALSVAGCAAPVSTGVKATPAQVAKYNDLPALDVVASLEKNVSEARNSGMPFLAPHYFRDASQVLSRCQNSLGNKARDELAACAAQGDAVLEKGRAVMEIVKYRFSQELAQKAQLDALDTGKRLPKEYAKAIGDLSALIDMVEREQPGNIDKEKEAVLKSMQALEVQSVQEGALHESETLNADSKKRNADKQAPLTFAEAQKIYQDAKAKIAAAYRDQPQVKRLGAEALFAARHAWQVNERVALLQTQLHISAGGVASAGTQVAVQADGKIAPAEKVSLEEIVLQEEARLQEVAAALGLKDMRDQPLDRQVEELKRAVRNLSSQPPRVEADTVALQDMEARLKAANEAARQAQGQVAERDQQLTAKDRQLEAQAGQLAEKDAQINALTEKISQQEKAFTKPAAANKKPVKNKTAIPAKP